MFVRVKNNGKYDYLQVVHNQRVEGYVKQNVIATLGRLDVLKATGKIDALIASCARFAEHTAVLDASRRNELAEALKVKEVRVGERRYIVSYNEDEAKKDKADRQAIVASLEEQLKHGAKSLVGNKGYRKYLKSISGSLKIGEWSSEGGHRSGRMFGMI